LLTLNRRPSVFFGLGFRDKKDCDAWYTTHLTNIPVGLIVDIHIVLEHIFNSSNTVDTAESGGLSQHLHSVKKLMMNNMTMAVAVCSFDSRLPKFFSRATTIPTGHKENASYFDRIPSYAAWDESGTGYRDRLKDEIASFEEAHQDLIDVTLQSETKPHSIATLSLSNSVSWLQLFVSYLEETYKDLMKHKFSTEKAWRLVTRLGRRIFLEVSKPRLGVNNAITPGENDYNGKAMFWPLVRCQDIMKRYKESSFRDDPTIASEYVKFLASTSGSETTDKLSLRFVAMESDIKEAIKAAKNASTSATTAANRSDEMKKTLTDLLRRISKLESK
jgi:hypothetical protein